MSVALVTGFEPFADYKVNPSQQVAERLNGQTVGAARVVGLTLPNTFGEDTGQVFRAIIDLQPSVVLSLGLDAGIACLRVERLAVNLRVSADYTDVPIVPDGPAAYFATINVDCAAEAIHGKGVPAQPHVYAGNHLCNHVMYQTLHFAATRSLPLRSGFIHIPLLLEQVVAENRMNKPSLPLETIVSGVRAAIEAALQ